MFASHNRSFFGRADCTVIVVNVAPLEAEVWKAAVMNGSHLTVWMAECNISSL